MAWPAATSSSCSVRSLLVTCGLFSNGAEFVGLQHGSMLPLAQHGTLPLALGSARHRTAQSGIACRPAAAFRHHGPPHQFGHADVQAKCSMHCLGSCTIAAALPACHHGIIAAVAWSLRSACWHASAHVHKTSGSQLRVNCWRRQLHVHDALPPLPHCTAQGCPWRCGWPAARGSRAALAT